MTRRSAADEASDEEVPAACGCAHAAAARVERLEIAVRAAAEGGEGYLRNPLPAYLGWVALDEQGEKIAKTATMEQAALVALGHLLAHGLSEVVIRERYFEPGGEARQGEPARYRLKLERVEGARAAHRPSSKRRAPEAKAMATGEADIVTGSWGPSEAHKPSAKRRGPAAFARPVGEAGIEIGTWGGDAGGEPRGRPAMRRGQKYVFLDTKEEESRRAASGKSRLAWYGADAFAHEGGGDDGEPPALGRSSATCGCPARRARARGRRRRDK
jgi:hypothetical protein